jgi:hypothetical protein
MDSDKINRWLTLAANVGVLIGLILLALEIRHSTQATQALLHQDILGYARDHNELLVSDENRDLANIVFRGESEPESLSAVELEKFILFTAYRMGAWESTFVHYDEGLLGERNWQLYDAWYSALIHRGPGYKVWWDEARHGYDQRFQDHVDRAFEQVRNNQ